MTPHIDRFVMKHEQRSAYSSFAVKVNSIASLNIFVVNNVLGCLLDVSNEGLEL